MRFFFRYFLDDYGLGSPINLVLYVILLLILLVYFVDICEYDTVSLRLKNILGSILGGWILLGFILYFNLNLGNIPTYGTHSQKATLKRCAEKHHYVEITNDNIADVMRICRTKEQDEVLRNEIFK